MRFHDHLLSSLLELFLGGCDALDYVDVPSVYEIIFQLEYSIDGCLQFPYDLCIDVLSSLQTYFGTSH